MQTKREQSSLVSLGQNLSSPLLGENLISPSRDYKCPRSPSNLSLQFNFEETRYSETAGNGPFDEKLGKVKAGGKNGQKRVKNSTLKTPRTGRNLKTKSYHVLNNEEPTELLEKQTAYGSTLNKSSRGVSTTAKIKPKLSPLTETTPSTDAYTSTGTGVRLATANTERERKRSTYDLREFLSLPPHKANSISAASVMDKPKQRGEKEPVRISLHSTNSKLSDDPTYDVFEFLALTAESSRPSTGVAPKKLKQLRPQKALKGKSTKSMKKLEIPSVIVADWSLKDESTRTKRLIRPSRELPKANFPTSDFPKATSNDLALETPRKSGQRKSVYDLKEFLTLPDVERLQKMKPKNIKPQSNSLESDSTREPDVKYDLAEFLNFLESGGGGSQGNATSREQAHSSRLGELTDLGLENRSVSVYDIYEFLKASNHKELPSGVDIRTGHAPSPQDARPLNVPITNEEKETRESCYDLREFLRLPAKIESNNSESEQTNRTNTAERLKIN